MTGDLLFRISYVPTFKTAEVSLYVFVLENSRETPGIGNPFKLMRTALMSKKKKKRLRFFSRIFSEMKC